MSEIVRQTPGCVEMLLGNCICMRIAVCTGRVRFTRCRLLDAALVPTRAVVRIGGEGMREGGSFGCAKGFGSCRSGLVLGAVAGCWRHCQNRNTRCVERAHIEVLHLEQALDPSDVPSALLAAFAVQVLALERTIRRGLVVAAARVAGPRLLMRSAFVSFDFCN